MLEKGLLNIKEKLTIIIPIIIVLAILVIFIKRVNTAEYYEKYLSEEVFSGTIINKFHDYNNHANESFYLSDIDHQEIKFNGNDWLELWNYSTIGDSIFKKKGERNLHLYRIREEDTIELNYNQNIERTFFKYRFDK